MNLTYFLGLIVALILLIMAMTLYVPPFASVALRIAFFFCSWNKVNTPALTKVLGSVDFAPEPPQAHLWDFHNSHYCTTQVLDPTHAVHKV